MSGPDDFIGELYQASKDQKTWMPPKLFQSTEKERTAA